MECAGIVMNMATQYGILILQHFGWISGLSISVLTTSSRGGPTLGALIVLLLGPLSPSGGCLGNPFGVGL